HGTWNVLVKVSGDPIATFRRATAMAAVIASLSIVPAWLFLGRPTLTGASVAWCLLSSVLETTYLWLLSPAYRRGDRAGGLPPCHTLALCLAAVHADGDRAPAVDMDCLSAQAVPTASAAPTSYLAPVDSNRHIFLGGLLPGPLGPEPGAARSRGPGPRDRDRRRGGLGGVALTRRGTDRAQAFRCTCDPRRSRAAGRLTRW